MTTEEADAIDAQTEIVRNMAATLCALGSHEIDAFEAQGAFQLMRHLAESVSERLAVITKGPFTKATD